MKLKSLFKKKESKSYDQIPIADKLIYKAKINADIILFNDILEALLRSQEVAIKNLPVEDLIRVAQSIYAKNTTEWIQ